MESRTISQIRLISVQKDSPMLQEGPPNQPGRPLHLRTPMNSLDRKGVGGMGKGVCSIMNLIIYNLKGSADLR